MVTRLAVLALLLAGACDVGSVKGTQPPGGDDTPAVDAPPGAVDGTASFNAMIKPLVNRCLGCHSTTQAPTLSSFTDLQAKYKTGIGAQNVLVTKGDATGGIHQGVAYFDATEKLTVGNWIDSIQ